MNYACSVEYQGTDFHGWQSQLNARSVQQDLENALSRVANEKIKVVCSGRTDSGVHALNQVVNFNSNADRSEKAWLFGTNANMPYDVSLNWVVPVDDSFSARYSALNRHYRYVIRVDQVRSALWHKRANWIKTGLDIEQMNKAAQYLVGEHDFTSYRSTNCQAKHPFRSMESIAVTQNKQFIYIDVIGNAFLHNMVRIISGMLMSVGLGEKEAIWAKQLLLAKDRTLGPKTAPAHGLYFIQPKYPQEFNLPEYSRYPEL